MFFKELHSSAGREVAKTECGHIIAGELSLLINFLGKFTCCSCLMTTVLEKLGQPFVGSTFEGIYTKPGVNYNALERALVESLGAGVCKTSNSTITGLHCRGRKGVFPGIFE